MNSSLKERLNTLRTNKTLVWQTAIVTIGGTLSLFIKALNSGTNPTEIVLMLAGAGLIMFLIHLISLLSEETEDLQSQLIKEEHKK